MVAGGHCKLITRFGVMQRVQWKIILFLADFDFKLFYCLTFRITFVYGQNVDK